MDQRAFAILDMPKNKILDNCIFGPLTEDQIIGVPSGRLIWVPKGHEAKAYFQKRFEAPEGFTKVSDSLSAYSVSQAHTRPNVPKLAKQQFNLEVPCYKSGYGHNNWRNSDGIDLKAWVTFKYWKIEVQDPELLYEIAKKVKTLFNQGAYMDNRIGRRKGFVVDELYHDWIHNIGLVQYDLAEWNERAQKRKKVRDERAHKVVHKDLLAANEANAIYWGLAEQLRKRMLGRGAGISWQWDGPGRAKQDKIAALMGIFKMGQRLFGKTFWVKRISKAGIVYRYEVDRKAPESQKWHRVPAVPYIRRRHRELKLKRPPAKDKFARFVWDMIHPPRPKRPATDSTRRSSASPPPTSSKGTGRRTSGSRKKTEKIAS